MAAMDEAQVSENNAGILINDSRIESIKKRRKVWLAVTLTTGLLWYASWHGSLNESATWVMIVAIDAIIGLSDKI